MVMLLTNHTLTGVVLGLSVDNPLVLAPVAVASHLALDMTPHFGTKALHNSFPNGLVFIVVGAADFTVSAAVLASACFIWPARAPNIIVGVAGACLPDLVYIPAIVFGRGNIERWLPFYRLMLKFLGHIQWYERPLGAITEVIWAGIMLFVLSGLR
jgi:hypothetical protein